MSTASGGFALAAEPLPRITLVTPSFNQAEFLEATLRSVIDQGYPNLEYIVIDGGSSDGSVDVIRRYSEHLAYCVSEPDRGHGHALNKGFNRSTGVVMGWINSDDILLPGSLYLVGSLFAQFPEMEWLTSPGAAIEPGGRIIGTHAKTPWTRARFLLARKHWIQQESTFWRRDLWERTGAGLSEEVLACDHELWARFFRHARLYQTDGLIGAFRYRPAQRSLELRNRYLREMRDVLTREEASREAQTLTDEKAEIYSEIRFDTQSFEFACHHTPFPLDERESALCRIEGALATEAQLVAVEPPPGGIEAHQAIRTYFPSLPESGAANYTFVWLGFGELSGLDLSLLCRRPRPVALRLLVAPGPSAGPAGVTLRLRHRAAAEPKTLVLHVSADGDYSCVLDLVEGRNTVSLFVDDAPAIADLGSGDPRHLMAAVRRIEFRASADAPSISAAPRLQAPLTFDAPVVSIVTPSFEQGPFLEETIQSVLRQRGDFYLDYIVMDGGSTDGSVEILAKYEALLRANCRVERLGELDVYRSESPDFPWNRCRGVSFRWQSGPDGGQIQALRAAFTRCVGALVAWINSDDYFLGDDAFARVLERHLADPSAMILTADCSVVDRDGKEMWKWAMGRINLRELIYLDYHIPQSSTFVRRDALGRYELDPTRKYTFDTEFFISILGDGNRLVKIDAEISAFRMYAENITDNPALKKQIFRERLRTLRQHSDNPFHAALAGLYQYFWYIVQPRTNARTRLGRFVTGTIDRYRELCYRTILHESYAQRYVK